MNNMKTFFERLRCFPKVEGYLNSGCTQIEIEKAQENIGFQLPVDLKKFYFLHNGQCCNEKGIFKILSGYDKYSRPKYLSLNRMIELHRVLSRTEYLSSIFNQSLLPIAVDNFENPDDVICYDLISGEVLLLWVLCYDPLSPIEWQISKVVIAESFEEFIRMQLETYRG